ncbi:DciA family protein [Brevundimonas sp. 2R-24]|uniref:DciA family protein n=1 Tax=Peiella sedimenti TaxID=3061083 RepID=A0ABT8SP41_9CAUL|nr:DciA family protein [Caulobacteraceae bacterium XZ-24]
MKRRLPTEAEAAEILQRRRTLPQRRPAPRAGRALAKLIRTLDGRFGQGVSGLEARWLEILGDAPLANVCRPERLMKSKSGGATLELRVVGAAAGLVQHRSAEIIERVNLFLGAGAVDRLRIVQGPVKPLAAKTAPPRRKPPLDAGAEAELTRATETVPDEPLREALLRLGRGALRGDRRAP